jgi:lipopolysaccharide biosynthesis glycosyltransferase
MYEKAVYIDSDTILRGDVGELFDIKLGEDEVIAAMRDPKVTAIKEFRDYVDNAVGVPHDKYVNDGVMLMSLKKMRKMKYLSTMIDLIQRYDADFLAPDQDYVNIILQNKIHYIGEEWNAEPRADLPDDIKLVHFNLFNKPWHYKNVPCENLFWDAARGTGFYGDLRRQQEAFDTEKQKAEHEKIGALLAKAVRLAKTKKPLIKL